MMIPNLSPLAPLNELAGVAINGSAEVKMKAHSISKTKYCQDRELL